MVHHLLTVPESVEAWIGLAMVSGSSRVSSLKLTWNPKEPPAKRAVSFKGPVLDWEIKHKL